MSQSFNWAQSFGLSGSQCGVNAIAIDDSNNVYSLGGFMNTVDFNAGAGVNNLTAIGTINGFLLKEDANGNFIWVKPFYGLSSGSLGIWCFTLTLDTAGNIYIAGGVKDSFDVDPGPNIHKISSPNGYDAYILKLNHNGDFIWVKQFGNTIPSIFTNVNLMSIKLDSHNNIYLASSFAGTIDVDPGVGVDTVSTQGTGTDILIEKLDSLGNFVWYKQIGGTQDDDPYAIELDSLCNLYFAGSYQGTVDFDPSPLNIASATTAGGYDFFIEKLDSMGNYIWAKQFGSSGYDLALGLTLDKHGNVLATGFFENTVDFNPGVGVYNIYSPSRDIFILKLDNAGNYVWAKSLYNSSSNQGGQSIITDLNESVYVTGITYGADFDPGPGTYYINGQGSGDIFVEKLDSSGYFINALEFGTSGYDYANTIRLDKFNNILLCGQIGAYNSPGSGDFDPGLGTCNMFGDTYGFLEKLCVTPPTINITALNDTICVGQTAYLSIESLQGAIYVWGKDGNPIPNSNHDTLLATQAGNYTVAIYGVGCPYASDTVHLTVLPYVTPNIQISSSPNYVPAGQQVSVFANVWNNSGYAYTINWYNHGVLFATTATNSTTYTKQVGRDSITAVVTLNTPCTTPVTSNYAVVTGIGDIYNQPSFSIFPNPTSNFLTIQTSQLGKLEITDLTGRLLLQSPITASTPLSSQILDISSLAQGVYLLRFSSNEGAVETVKVVKE